MASATRQRPGTGPRRRDSLVGPTVAALARNAEQVATLLASPEIAGLVADLEATRWTGRPGYPIKAMVGMALVKAAYTLPTWTRTARLVAEHAALGEAIGGAPSVFACYRFTVKLRTHSAMLTACLDRVIGSLRDHLPELGDHLAIDGSDLPAYAKGHRHLFKNLRAGQGLRRLRDLRDLRGPQHPADHPAEADLNVFQGLHNPPKCKYGTWTFAGSDIKRSASKWRCPKDQCQPGSTWVKADRLHTLIPRTTDRWKALYRERVGIEREFGVLKHEWAMLPLRVRRVSRVRLHVDLTILARLATALAKVRAVPVAA